MTPAEWQRVRSILESALELPPQGRDQFLENACGEASVRREVEALICLHEEAGTDFLNSPAKPAFPFRDEVQFGLVPGKRIGAYEILDEIAQGGMGAVYRAIRADGQYTQHVALKIVRADFGAELTAARFRNERQILASLDHPNIAKILDGGTTAEGVPYFVMELIDGLPITDYCDQHRLSIDERLKLFRTVCAAVLYAHQRLVIHRDIKPTNILITADGVPKLLDFGIAKVLDPGAIPGNVTMTAGLWMLTPEYASPEQLRGEVVTTAADVYSLGLILYELLTGRRTYKLASRMPYEISEFVSRVEPQRPSLAIDESAGPNDSSRDTRSCEDCCALRNTTPAKLHKRLSGDLDNIVQMALRKDPSRRYSSVEHFAGDIQRNLEHLPVTAREDTTWYRISKFTHRHRTGVLASAAVALAILSGSAVALYEARVATKQAEIARQQRLRAERRFNDVRKLANSLIFEIHDSIRDLPGSTPARHLIVNRALEYLDSLSQQAKGDVSLQRELAAAYARVGDALGYTYAPNLGDNPGALQSYRKALDILEPLADISPDDVRLQRDLADSYLRMASVLEATGDFGKALNSVERDLAIMQRITAANNDPELLDRLAGAHYFRADLLGRAGDNARALENYQWGASILEGALRADPSRRPLRTHLAGDYAGIALTMSKSGQIVQAIEGQTKAVRILEEICQTSANNATAREFLAEAIDQLAQFRLNKKEGAAALETAKRGHQIFRELWLADPKNSLAKWNFASSDLHAGDALLLLGRPTPALQAFQEAAATFEDGNYPLTTSTDSGRL